MKKLTIIIFCFALIVTNVSAAIIGIQILELDFTNPAEVQKKAEWSDKQYFKITESGLGFEGANNESRDLSVETTELLPIGVSWRVAYSSVVRVEVNFSKIIDEITLPNGEKTKVGPFPGRMFVRHSPDTKNWSSWQELGRDVEKKPDSTGERFQGTVGVPNSDRKVYDDYLSEYQRMDVPWASDEEAAVKWILKEKNPNFFEEHIPFVGYLQFRYESSLRGGERLKNIKINVSYGVGGLHSSPKDKSAYENREGPWRFQSP